MIFLQWYVIGVAIVVLLFVQQAIRDNVTLKKAYDEVYDLFIRRADKLSTVILLLVALLGPLLIPAIAYFQLRSWQDSLAVDEDGNRDYPWSKE